MRQPVLPAAGASQTFADHQGGDVAVLCFQHAAIAAKVAPEHAMAPPAWARHYCEVEVAAGNKLVQALCCKGPLPFAASLKAHLWRIEAE